MHFVAALDKMSGMRAVLCLFEGVVTGAADGYGRMAEKPACTQFAAADAQAVKQAATGGSGSRPFCLSAALALRPAGTCPRRRAHQVGAAQER
jgi:hypothetical protein